MYSPTDQRLFQNITVGGVIYDTYLFNIQLPVNLKCNHCILQVILMILAFYHFLLLFQILLLFQSLY